MLHVAWHWVRSWPAGRLALVGGLALAAAVRLALPADPAAAPSAPAPVPAVPAQGPANAPLQAKVIVVDPGHGGRDNGGVGVSGVREKDVVLAVALHLRDQLAAAGARVVLTRDADRDMRDEVTPIDGSKWRGELAYRAGLAAQHQAHALVSIHANLHGRNTPWQGAQTFWDRRGHAGSERLAQDLMAALREHTPTKRVHRPIEQFVLARTAAPAVTVEVGFLSNAAEEQRLTDAAYQQQLARAIAAGLVRYFAAAP